MIFLNIQNIVFDFIPCDFATCFSFIFESVFNFFDVGNFEVIQKGDLINLSYT